MCGGLKMIHILNEDFNSEQIAELISICKSDSGSMGTKLRNAHYELGKRLVQNYKNLFSSQCCIISFMRSAIPFSFGLAEILDCPILFYDSKDSDFFDRNKEIVNNKHVLFVDAVINTGKGMLDAISQSRASSKDIKILSNVLCDKAIEKFTSYEVFTVRVSKNSFKGEKVLKQIGNKGPDTGDRLFRTFL